MSVLNRGEPGSDAGSGGYPRTESRSYMPPIWKSVIPKTKGERQKLRESAVRRLEKKLIEHGYESLEEFSADRRHADKCGWGQERIAELEQIRQVKRKREKEQPVQLSLC